MRLPPGLQTAEPTPTAAEGANGDGALAAAADLAWDQTVDAARWLGGLAFNLLWAAIVIIGIVYVSGRLRHRVRRTIERRVRARNNLPALLDNVIQIVVYIVAGAFALSALGANANALVSTIGLITAAVSLSLQDVLKNFVAGLYLLAEQPFAIGDRLEVSGQVGTVEQINVRTTVLRNDRADQVLVPNYQVFSQVVSNRSAYRLRTLAITVSGAAGDPNEALATAAAALADPAGTAAQTPPTLELTKVGPNGADLAIIIWTPSTQDLRHDVIHRLRSHFPDATISVTP